MSSSPIPFIFTLSTAGRYAILISQVLVDMLDDAEKKSLLARELFFIKEGTVEPNTMLALIAGSLTSLCSAANGFAVLIGAGNAFDNAPRFIRATVLSMTAPVAAFLLHIFTDKDAVIKADIYATELMGTGKPLSRVLEKLSDRVMSARKVWVNPSHIHMYPVDILDKQDPLNIHLSLFSVHPLIEKRNLLLNRLEGTEE